MPKKPVAFISFRFEPINSVTMFGDPGSNEQTGALQLLIWRKNKSGKAEVDETYEMGRAQDIEGFERLTRNIESDLRLVNIRAKEWFPVRRGFWR